jgi:predicted amidohydrolase YtcJ
MANMTVFVARKIITMDGALPTATAVAVRDGRIVEVGSAEKLSTLPGAEIDRRFADKIVMPGFIEGHAHVGTGAIWDNVYLGYFDRVDPAGKVWTGLKTLDAVVERLQDAHEKTKDSGKPLTGWGFDPIYFGGQRMEKQHLDRVSATRPIVVIHQTFHALNVNTATLEAAGMTESAPVEGLHMGADGTPTGELREFAIMFMAMAPLKVDFFSSNLEDRSVWDYASIAHRTGTTTTCDMVNTLSGATLDVFERVTKDEKFPMRLVPMLSARAGDPTDAVKRMPEILARANPKLKLGRIKIVTDGAITGFTARLLPPGYYNGAPNGQWNVTADELRKHVEAYHQAGYQMHIHANGDEASAMTLEVLEAVLPANPKPGLRHTMQHCQLMDAGQFARAKTLGLTVNIFTNHLYFYGDEHYRQTLGPERSAKLDAAASALKAGLPLAIHSDSPVTPLAPLFTAWVAINRKTAGGRVLGETERLTLDKALYAITMGAAYSLCLDDEIGSISPGKSADFTILDADPYETPTETLKDIPIWGTVVGGTPFPLAK